MDPGDAEGNQALSEKDSFLSQGLRKSFVRIRFFRYIRMGVPEFSFLGG